MKRFSIFTLILALTVSIFSGCNIVTEALSNNVAIETSSEAIAYTKTASTVYAAPVTIDSIPSYTAAPYIEVNENVPYFTADEITTTSFEYYTPLDNLGRCGVAYACIGQDIMPTEERGAIGQVKPSGWHTVKYDFVDGKYLYNRCHLIAYMLAGENDNTKNLITGTRYFNTKGMLPFEEKVADYVNATGNHVMYRVTPMYDDSNLVANGVLMEALSVEDDGNGISFCVFCYNIQPGVIIDYATGESALASDAQVVAETETVAETEAAVAETAATQKAAAANSNTSNSYTYVLNTNSKKFHTSTCRYVKQMKDKNKGSYTGTRSEVIALGYEPCKVCGP